jgi:hypothetical protein
MARSLLILATVSFALAVGAGVAQADISSFTVNPRATLSADRTQATVTGTVTCTSGDLLGLFASVDEVVGRVDRSAFGQAYPVTCTGGAQPWSVVASIPAGSTLRMVPGPASVTAGAFDNTDFTFANFSGTTVLVP